jgi:hypothetical protein
MSATATNPEFVFETNQLPSWTIPFLNMLSLATSCVDAIFFQRSQAQHLNADPHGGNGFNHESSTGGWSMCDDSITAVSNSGHPMAEFYRDQFKM